MKSGLNIFQNVIDICCLKMRIEDKYFPENTKTETYCRKIP